MFIISLTDFISENTRPISIKFYVQLHGRDGVGWGLGGFYLNGPGQMTKMAATSSPYMVLTRLRSFSLILLG